MLYRPTSLKSCACMYIRPHRPRTKEWFLRAHIFRFRRFIANRFLFCDTISYQNVAYTTSLPPSNVIKHITAQSIGPNFCGIILRFICKAESVAYYMELRLSHFNVDYLVQQLRCRYLCIAFVFFIRPRLHTSLLIFNGLAGKVKQRVHGNVALNFVVLNNNIVNRSHVFFPHDFTVVSENVIFEKSEKIPRRYITRSINDNKRTKESPVEGTRHFFRKFDDRLP